MPIASDDLRLFGLDLRNVWHELKSPWVKLVNTPSWAWLAPRVAVNVTDANGSAAGVWAPSGRIRGFRQVENAATPHVEGGKAYVAVLTPEHLVLRKRMYMPLIDQEQMQRAVALEAESSNPFAAGDLVWGYALDPVEGDAKSATVGVDMVLASRGRIARHFADRTDVNDPVNAPEVWALSPGRQDTAMALGGFGEAKRLVGTRRYWSLVSGLLVLAVLLCVAIAVTPYLQLRARVMQANTAYAMLDQRAAPQLAKREALVKAEGEVKDLADIIGHRLDTLQVVQMLTNVLPDDTVLQRLQIEGRKVVIAGDTSDSSALMQKLGSMPEVREVRAPSAAVRRPGMTKESFQIEFQLSEEFGVSADDAAVAAALAPAGTASTSDAAQTAATAASTASGASAPAASASVASSPGTTPSPAKGGAR